MNERDDDGAEGRDIAGSGAGADDAQYAALLRRAGRYPPPDAAARAHAFEVVHAQWRESLTAAPAASAVAAAAAAAAPAAAPESATTATARLRPSRPRWPYALAASLALVTLAGLLWRSGPGVAAERFAVAEVVQGSVFVQRSWLQGGDAPLQSQAAVNVGDEIALPAASGASLRLGNGINVRLAAGTRIHLASIDAITLDAGTLYVDADPRRARAALHVATALGRVEHLGTQYSVTSGPGLLEVAVREGRVRVAGASGAAAPTPAEAGAGELLRIDAGGHVARGAVETHGPRWAWLAGLATPFSMDGATLQQFLDWYTRETGMQVAFGDEAAARRRDSVLSGSIAGLAPEAALQAVAASSGLELRRGAGTVELQLR
jgi:ferric-dicitrate binding protein FerR (iron transport regulator)